MGCRKCGTLSALANRHFTRTLTVSHDDAFVSMRGVPLFGLEMRVAWRDAEAQHNNGSSPRSVWGGDYDDG